MPNIKIDLVGDDTGAALEDLQKLVKKSLGTDVMLTGATTTDGTLKTLTAVTLALAVPTMLAHPQGIMQQLGNQKQQDAFLSFLLDLARQYNIDLTLTTPDGRRFNFADISLDDLRRVMLGM